MGGDEDVEGIRIAEDLQAGVLQLEPYASDKSPPMTPATTANTRYIVPMSL